MGGGSIFFPGRMVQHNMNKNRKFRAMEALSLVAVFGLSIVALQGCNGNAPIDEDKAVTAKRVETAKSLRSYYDKSNGNYDGMSQEDKDAVNKITGSEANTRTAFGHMGPTAAPPKK